MATADIAKAFDTAPYTCFLSALLAQVHPHSANTISSMSEGVTSILPNGQIVQIHRGVKQGDPPFFPY